MTEINVNADYGDDPAGRPWGAYGVAWGASAFRSLALGGAGLVHQYSFVAGAQFGMVDETSGRVYLPYWRDLLLSQAFPAGSTIVGGTSSQTGIETLAVRRPGGNLSVLVVNRTVDSASAVGGAGLTATVMVDLGLKPVGLRVRQLDARTNATNGPGTQIVVPERTLQLDFPGYGMAVVDVDVAGSAPPPDLSTVLTLSTKGTGTIARSPAGGGGDQVRYARDTIVRLVPQPAAGATFIGWHVDGQFQGWPDPLSITMNNDHTVVATFAASPTFTDVSPGQPSALAIAELAARDYLRGYGDGAFGPTVSLLRIHIAGIIARAMGYTDTPPNTFTDRCAPNSTEDCVDAELWNRLAELTARRIAKGYSDAPSCAPSGVPCYAPRAFVSHVQALSLIARAMIDARYWVQQPIIPTLYGGVLNGSDHEQDVATFLFYTRDYGGVPDYPTSGQFSDWDQPSSRGWFARALWTALNSYWSGDRVP